MLLCPMLYTLYPATSENRQVGRTVSQAMELIPNAIGLYVEKHGTERGIMRDVQRALSFGCALGTVEARDGDYELPEWCGGTLYSQ